MTVEQRMDQPEQRNKRLTMALMMLVVAMATTGDKHGDFDSVTARSIWVTNDAGDVAVRLGANDAGNGLVYMKSAKGKRLVKLTARPPQGPLYFLYPIHAR